MDFGKKIIFLSVTIILLGAGILNAQQSPFSLNDTATMNADEAPADAAPILDKKWNHIQTKYFTLNFGIAVFLDHNTASQNTENLQQVGDIPAATEFRGERLIFSGTFFSKNPWRYMISLNYNGLDTADGKDAFSVIDLNLEIPLSKTAGWITFGKQKEGVGYEYILPGSQSFFMERGSGVPAFIRQRNIGIRYSNSILNQRMTYTAGIFNSWLEQGNKNSFSNNGIQVTSRVTGLPMYESDRGFVHVAIGYRYTDATNGKLSYKAKPEVNTAPSFINTGSFDARAAHTLMFEWLGVKGPVALMAEYMIDFVNSSASHNPHFNYWTVEGSWFLTGENRKYNKQIGVLGKLIPKKNLTFEKGGGIGALELDARYTSANFTDQLIYGGNLGRFTAGLGWYPNAHFRFEVNYGHAVLNKANLNGKVDFWQLRAQFEL